MLLDILYPGMKTSFLFPTDGSSNKNPPGRCRRPLYSRDPEEEDPSEEEEDRSMEEGDDHVGGTGGSSEGIQRG